VVRTLGLEWEPTSDTFQFRMQVTGHAKSKREILSAISKLFDPLGIVSPIIVRAKLIMQETWRTNIEWDDILPDRIQMAWNDYIRDLENFGAIHVPRHVMSRSPHDVINLHAFCDSSERAYDACVYVQTTSQGSNLQSMLLCAKTRVKKLTIPRLELCGAVLLAKLVDTVKRALQIEFTSIHVDRLDDCARVDRRRRELAKNIRFQPCHQDTLNPDCFPLASCAERRKSSRPCVTRHELRKFEN